MDGWKRAVVILMNKWKLKGPFCWALAESSVCCWKYSELDVLSPAHSWHHQVYSLGCPGGKYMLPLGKPVSENRKKCRGSYAHLQTSLPKDRIVMVIWQTLLKKNFMVSSVKGQNRSRNLTYIDSFAKLYSGICKIGKIKDYKTWFIWIIGLWIFVYFLYFNLIKLQSHILSRTVLLKQMRRGHLWMTRISSTLHICLSVCLPARITTISWQ